MNRLTGKKVESCDEIKNFNGVIDGCHQNNNINMGETKIKVNL